MSGWLGVPVVQRIRRESACRCGRKFSNRPNECQLRTSAEQQSMIPTCVFSQRFSRLASPALRLLAPARLAARWAPVASRNSRHRTRMRTSFQSICTDRLPERNISSDHEERRPEEDTVFRRVRPFRVSARPGCRFAASRGTKALRIDRPTTIVFTNIPMRKIRNAGFSLP